MIKNSLKLEPNGALLTSYIHDDEKIREAILVFPGGAYKYCAPKEGEPVATAYYTEGFNAFVLEYSCTDGLYNSPKLPLEEVHDAAVEDAMNVFYYLTDNHEFLHINPDKISLVGFSAGANLALSSVIYGKITPLSMILNYGAYSDEVMEFLGMEKLQLLEKVDSNCPPVFMSLCQGDTTVPASESLRLADVYFKNKIPFEMHVYVSGDHGLSLADEKCGVVDQDYSTWFYHSLRFLRNIQLKTPLHLGDISRDLKLLNTESRLGALMYHEKAWALIENLFPELSKKCKEDPNFGHRSLSRYYELGLISNPNQEELNELLNKCR